MKCPNCGFENRDTNNFCMKCGTKLTTTSQTEPPVTETEPEEMPAPSPEISSEPLSPKNRKIGKKQIIAEDVSFSEVKIQASEKASVKTAKKSPKYVVSAIIIALIILSGLFVLLNKENLIPNIKNAVSSVFRLDKRIHGTFCGQYEQFIYYLDEDASLCRIAVGGRNNEVISSGPVSDVLVGQGYVYFNTENNTNVCDVSHGKPDNKNVDIKLDCFDILYYDYIGGCDIYGLCNGTLYRFDEKLSGKEILLTDINIDAKELRAFENQIILLDNNYTAYLIYGENSSMTDSYKYLYEYPKVIGKNYLKIAKQKNFGYILGSDNQLYKFLSKDGSTSYSEIWDPILYTYLSYNPMSSADLTGLNIKINDFDVFGDNIAITDNDNLFIDNGYGFKVINEKCTNIGLVGSIAYFTRSEDGVLCRTAPDGSGYEEITVNNSSEPSVHVLFAESESMLLPYISSPDNSFDETNREILTIYNVSVEYCLFDNDLFVGSRYESFNDEQRMQMILWYDSYYSWEPDYEIDRKNCMLSVIYDKKSKKVITGVDSSVEQYYDMNTVNKFVNDQLDTYSADYGIEYIDPVACVFDDSGNPDVYFKYYISSEYEASSPELIKYSHGNIKRLSNYAGSDEEYLLSCYQSNDNFKSAENKFSYLYD